MAVFELVTLFALAASQTEIGFILDRHWVEVAVAVIHHFTPLTLMR